MAQQKTIHVAPYGNVDITPILPIINHPAFLRLHKLRQLGCSYVVFPGAQHTRYEHSLGVYELTRRRTEQWVRHGYISKAGAKNLNLFGLFHDVGHPPYSHVSECLCEMNHKEYGELIIRSMEDVIQKCGGNVHVLVAMLRGEEETAIAVSHRTLGTDKLDYLLRDSMYTTGTINFRLDDVIHHTHFLDGQIAIDQRIISVVEEVQDAYVRAHARCYLRKGCLIAQRFLQKIAALEMEANVALTEQLLCSMNDSRLDALLRNSEWSEEVPMLFAEFEERRFPKQAVGVYPKTAWPYDTITGKDIATQHWDFDELQAFSKYQNPLKTFGLEERLCEALDLDAEPRVLFIPVTSPERYLPADVYVRQSAGALHLLRDVHPAHMESLREQMMRSVALRVCVPSRYRKGVSEQDTAARVFDVLRESV